MVEEWLCKRNALLKAKGTEVLWGLKTRRSSGRRLGLVRAGILGWRRGAFFGGRGVAALARGATWDALASLVQAVQLSGEPSHSHTHPPPLVASRLTIAICSSAEWYYCHGESLSPSCNHWCSSTRQHNTTDERDCENSDSSQSNILL